MKRIILAVALAALALGPAFAQNPLLQKRFNTPYEIPPFEVLTIDNFREGMLVGMEQEKAEIQAIVDNPEEPGFENVIVALENCGKTLQKTRSVWGSLNSASSTPELQAFAREMAPLTAAHSNEIRLNSKLFEKVKYVWDHQEKYGLDKEQKRLLQKTYEGYVNGGALLDEASKRRLAELNLELSQLQLQFSQNLLHDTNNTYVIVDNVKELEGLPKDNVDRAAALAERIGEKGRYAFNMQRPSCNPVLQYCRNRDLRKRVYEMYNNRCNHGDQYDNKAISARIIALRLERAKIMGYTDYAAMSLKDRMAENAGNVYALLDQIWAPAVKKANEEIADIKAMMKRDRVKGEPQPWDYMYYLDKAKKAKFDIDESVVSEYLEINAVQQGIFYVAGKLYGLSFAERTQDYPSYEPTAKSWDVIDPEGNVIAIFYSDYFPRDGKGAGAWCGAFRGQKYEGAQRVQPIVTNVCNMTLPSADKPALQTLDNVETMFHEFGHALHSFFRNVHYTGVSGVERDFVELPSQINEHWAFEPEVLKVYAKHYKTGETIPQELVDKIAASEKYGQGFATVEYLAASYVDMDLHTLTEVPADLDVMAFQKEKLAARGIPKQILPRYSVTNFSHSIGGGYSAGYYSYIWAEVLDCDAFQAFKETGDIFNPEVARRFRDFVLTPGGIDKGSVMYRNFRGRDPEVGALLENRGLEKPAPASKAKAVNGYESQRPAPTDRLFTSQAVERKIAEVQAQLKNPRLAWMFGNCFPNTLDTTVHFGKDDKGRWRTFVYTGDIHAMWLRDSGAQVWPYVQLANEDEELKDMLAGVINCQFSLIGIDPYANAFNDGPTGGGWQDDLTDMDPNLHERKWEIDSHCYPIRLAYHYWKTTGDTSVFGELWMESIRKTLTTFRQQQRKENRGPYNFQRVSHVPTDTQAGYGWGNPVRPVGLIASAFRPSDDATTYMFLIPSNFFAVTSLRKAAEILDTVNGEPAMAAECLALAAEVEEALHRYATVEHPKYGTIYAFEVDGFGNKLMMDDANVPSLLAMPYLGDVASDDPVYQNTRRFVWSEDNPFFFKGKAGEGIGGPHVGMNYIWPMSIMMKAFTSSDDAEIKACIESLMTTDAGTGFMHESFHKDDPANFTRAWFAWQNTLFGELILKLIDEGKLPLLNSITIQ